MPGKSFIDNPFSKGNKIERLEYYSRSDEHFAAITKVVPFSLTPDPDVVAWWQRASDDSRVEMFCVGKPSKTPDQRLVAMLVGCDQKVVTGDTPNSHFFVRRYPSMSHQTQMLKVRPRGAIPGYACNVWWEVRDANNPNEGPAILCIGMKPLAGGAATKDTAGDDLEAMSKAQLLTKAGVEGVKSSAGKSLDDSMGEGEIIAHIRAHRESKKSKETKPKPKSAVV